MGFWDLQYNKFLTRKGHLSHSIILSLHINYGMEFFFAYHLGNCGFCITPRFPL
jgi:hypothetical protein